jgi:hypothetical protein
VGGSVTVRAEETQYLSNFSSKMAGKSKVLNISHKYYPARPKIPLQHCHDNGYNNTHSQILYHNAQNPLKTNDQQPTKLSALAVE